MAQTQQTLLRTEAKPSARRIFFNQLNRIYIHRPHFHIFNEQSKLNEAPLTTPSLCHKTPTDRGRSEVKEQSCARPLVHLRATVLQEGSETAASYAGPLSCSNELREFVFRRCFSEAV